MSKKSKLVDAPMDALLAHGEYNAPLLDELGIRLERVRLRALYGEFSHELVLILYFLKACQFRGYSRKRARRRFLGKVAIELLVMLKRALKNRDGTPFRNLADAIEAIGKRPVDPIRLHLIDMVRTIRAHLTIDPLKEIFFAPGSIKKILLERHGHSIDERVVRRVCDELGIMRSHEKGRPKRIVRRK